MLGLGWASATAGRATAPLSNAGVVAYTNAGVEASAPDGGGRRVLTPSGVWFSDDVSKGTGGAPVTVLVHAWDNPSGSWYGLYAVRADGTGSPVLLQEALAPARIIQARFSRDGAKVSFLGSNGVAPVVWSIYTADVVRDGSGSVTGLANVASAYDTGNWLGRGRIDFTRSGNGIVFSMADDLWMLDLSTHGLTQLTATAEVEANPASSPVDDRIAYERWPSASSSGQNGLICTVNVSTGTVATITTRKNGGLAAAFLSNPCWSPDGGVILFNAHDSSTSDLWQIASDGGGKAVNATNDGAAVWESYPAWGW